ncbi:MAG: hypothetical protein ACFCU3_12250 [Verrucomicrobiales bacterium]
MQTIAPAQIEDGGLISIPLEQLSDRSLSRLAQSAIELPGIDWVHAETENFVYHYSSSATGTPVAVEAEHYYRFIAQDLKKDTTNWERKGHIIIFESPQHWETFKRNNAMDPWTGGFHIRNELYIIRDPSYRFKGHALGHEVGHLVLHRFYGGGIPLWLNEGYCENVSIRAYSTFYRRRGYRVRPWSYPVSPDDYMEVQSLQRMVDYPADPSQVMTFYALSEKLVRFLRAQDPDSFLKFLEAMAEGSEISTALSRSFPRNFSTLLSLERGFKNYALQEFAAESRQTGE